MKEKNFSWLLVALLVFLVAVPVLDETELFPPRLTRALIVSWLLGVGVWSLRGFGRYFRIGRRPGGCWSRSERNCHSDPVHPLSNIRLLMPRSLASCWWPYGALCGRSSFDTGDQCQPTCRGGQPVYLLLGVLWSTAIYTVIELAAPGSFDGLSASVGHGPWDSSSWLYFSFVTMTTLGYGDLLPVSAVARVAAVHAGRFRPVLHRDPCRRARQCLHYRPAKQSGPIRTSAASRKNK